MLLVFYNFFNFINERRCSMLIEHKLLEFLRSKLLERVFIKYTWRVLQTVLFTFQYFLWLLSYCIFTTHCHSHFGEFFRWLLFIWLFLPININWFLYLVFWLFWMSIWTSFNFNSYIIFNTILMLRQVFWYAFIELFGEWLRFLNVVMLFFFFKFSCFITTIRWLLFLFNYDWFINNLINIFENLLSLIFSHILLDTGPACTSK